MKSPDDESTIQDKDTRLKETGVTLLMESKWTKQYKPERINDDSFYG
jgi:hypothetical protein